jgi:hypothetical protein
MSALRLVWRRTWENQPRDFSCDSPEADMPGIVGRVHETLTPTGQPHWVWYCHGRVGGSVGPQPISGTAATKDEAAHMVEERWFAWLAQARALGLIRMHEGNRADWPEIARHNARALGRA